MQFTFQLTPAELLEILTDRQATNAAIARIEAALKGISMDIAGLKAAVADNIKAQGEQFAAQADEDANIEKAIAALASAVGNDPALQEQVDALTAATANQRAANTAAIAENAKLAAALGLPVPPVVA